VKELANAKAALETVSTDCMQTAADHEATVKARSEELKVIAEAKKILVETTSGAVDQAYSLLQRAQAVSHLHTRMDLANIEVLTLVKKLAREHHSAALAQLASRISAVMRFGTASGQDPFAKVKELIQGLITKLESEASSEATEKAYCDEQMAKTEEKKAELEHDISKLTAKLDQSVAKSASLKEDVKELQSELAALAKQQAEMDQIRQETHADYVTAKADLEAGLGGVRKALGVLRDYYGGGAAMIQADSGLGNEMKQPAMPEQHAKATGAGQSIIGILEVVESDFAKDLAAEETAEDDAETEYQTVTQQNKVTKTLKDQDVKYKTAEAKALDKAISELTSDKETSDAELSAVLDYYAKIKERCIAKPETYEERAKRRTAEIAGLKEALSILEDETAFVQRGKRGVQNHFLGMH
jgi:chromosome segregation ATPase